MLNETFSVIFKQFVSLVCTWLESNNPRVRSKMMPSLKQSALEIVITLKNSWLKGKRANQFSCLFYDLINFPIFSLHNFIIFAASCRSGKETEWEWNSQVHGFGHPLRRQHSGKTCFFYTYESWGRFLGYSMPEGIEWFCMWCSMRCDALYMKKA